MTKTTGKDVKRKYNHLDKKGTTKSRQDYIETSYIHGVKDDKGEIVIRPMTKEEKEWLSQFVSETEHGNLNGSKEIKSEVKALKALRASYRKAQRESNVDEMERIFPLVEEKLQHVEALRESVNNFYISEDDVKGIYTRDNERRRDIYNKAKMSDNLVMYDLNEYDKFTTEAITDVSPEDLILEHLDTIPVRTRKKY